MNRLASKIMHITLVVVALLLSLSPLYGFGYIIFMALGAHHLKIFRAFSSYFARLILSFLVIAGSIMLAGLLVWIIDYPVHPLFVILLYVVLVGVIRLSTEEDLADTKTFDNGDLVSIGLALVAPLVLFYTYSTAPAPVFQIASEGWDNGSHVLMLEDVAKHNKYLYGPLDELSGTIIQETNAYPKAWHLATANTMNGFGSNLFDPTKPIQTMYAYVGAIIAWMFIAAYCFTRVAWYVATGFFKRRLNSMGELIAFSSVILLVQMIVIWGAFVSGFSNYLGMLAYLSVLVGIVSDRSKGNRHALLTLGILIATAGTLCWFLPAPALMLMAAMILPLSIGSTKIKGLLKELWKKPVHTLLILALVLLALFQIAIFALYSTIGGDDQLTTGVATVANGVVNGVFPVSQLLFLAASLFTVGYWLTNQHSSTNRNKTMLAIVVPSLVLVIGLYAYQMLTAGYTSYYLPKTMGIALIPIGIFLACGLAFWTSDFTRKFTKQSNVATAMAGILIIGLVLVGTNQSAFGGMKLLQRNARVGLPTAQALVDYLETADHSKTNVIVLRDHPDRPHEDRNGKFEARVIHQPLTCTYGIIKGGNTLKTTLKRLDGCAKKMEKRGRNIVVITSSRTKAKVDKLGRSNIIIKNISD